MTALSLFFILALSVGTYIVLARRHTTHGRRTAVWEWAVNRGFKFGPTGDVKIVGIDHWPHHRPDVLEHLRRGPVTIVRVRSLATGDAAAPRYWNLLIQEVASDTLASDAAARDTATVALRPNDATGSVIDLFELQMFPKLSNESRFSVFGTETLAARRLANGPAAALIPRDIGLVRTGRALILDFTSRPFDTVEFTRVSAIATQLADKL